MESEKIHDVIVVGAGIEGSATAYYLAKQGRNTLLLEQFPLPHGRGSSHGQSRITRKAYGNKDFYTVMMNTAYKLTAELEKECGEELFKNCGCLILGPKGETFLEEIRAAMLRQSVPHEIFGVEKAKKIYPGLSYPSDYEFILDKSGGLLRAEKMLKAFQTLFVRYGGILRDGEPMLDVQPGEIVAVKTSRGIHRGKSLVLTLGPWATKFLPRLGLSLPLTPLRVSACYWKVKVPGRFTTSTFPCFVDKGAHVYGLPAEEYPGLVKVALHTGPKADPDQRDKVDSSGVLKTITAYVAEHMPGLESTPSVVEACMYTNTPDEDFILDIHPAWKNIVIGAGFSGHGFKLSPVVGQILGQLAMGKTPEHDMTPFKINRFFKEKL